MRGPSIQDCEKSFARTGIPSKNLDAKRAAAAGNPVAARLIQIQGVSVAPPIPSAQPAAAAMPAGD